MIHNFLFLQNWLQHAVINSPSDTKYFVHYNLQFLCGVRRKYIGKEGTVKGKAVPLQAWSGPEDSRKLRFPDFMTTTQDGGKVVSLTHQPPLPPGNTPGTHFC
jgi:hypothetical protein